MTEELVPRALTDRQARQLQQGIRALVRRFSLAERSDMSCCGMTVAQAATLQALTDGALRLGELSKRLGIAASTLTRNISRLEDRGLLYRVGDPDDGRAQRVDLTETGRLAAAEVDLQEVEFARSVVECLPPDSVTSTLDGFNQLLAAVRRATEHCCPGAYDHLMSEMPPCTTGGCDE
jgi:DNA-binding MarR family transcriptional regulator